MARIFLLVSSFLGFFSVALGAFGAHALKSRFDDYQMSVYHTGIQYQFFHSFALALVGLLILKFGELGAYKLSGIAFVIGIALFSGSLYLIAFTKIKTWGAVTPFGGLSLLLGWSALAWAIFQQKFE